MYSLLVIHVSSGIDRDRQLQKNNSKLSQGVVGRQALALHTTTVTNICYPVSLNFPNSFGERGGNTGNEIF